MNTQSIIYSYNESKVRLDPQLLKTRRMRELRQQLRGMVRLRVVWLSGDDHCRRVLPEVQWRGRAARRVRHICDLVHRKTAGRHRMGHVGDRIDRRTSLSLSILIMSCSRFFDRVVADVCASWRACARVFPDARALQRFRILLQSGQCSVRRHRAADQRRDRIKLLLLWDRNGFCFWLFMNQLERDRFVWPRKEAVLKLHTEQLHWLLDGIDIEAMRVHPTRYYQRVT